MRRDYREPRGRAQGGGCGHARGALRGAQARRRVLRVRDRRRAQGVHGAPARRQQGRAQRDGAQPPGRYVRRAQRLPRRPPRAWRRRHRDGARAGAALALIPTYTPSLVLSLPYALNKLIESLYAMFIHELFSLFSAI